MSDHKLTIEPGGEKTSGPCTCCNQMTRRIWGYAYQSDSALAAYFVEWTPGHQDNGAAFDLILGSWGDEADNTQRLAVSLEFRRLETGPAFMVVDAQSKSVSRSPLISRALSRNEVVGQPIASTAYAVCDAIYLLDSRFTI